MCRWHFDGVGLIMWRRIANGGGRVRGRGSAGDTGDDEDFHRYRPINFV